MAIWYKDSSRKCFILGTAIGDSSLREGSSRGILTMRSKYMSYSLPGTAALLKISNVRGNQRA